MEWSPEFEDILRKYCRSSPGSAPLDPNALLTSIGIDSVGIVGLIVSIEDTFAISLHPSNLSAEVFATPKTLWAAVEPLIPRHT